ncbi:hypothetical protein VII00023_18939 [Vibrio ichthyoenteri ATCC 700023]|uniref:Uncharacterized protein n=1 Tax=Vibrio ichthyoenteri ATCC 700023 TaxID=870968 RepID=F9S5A8_9VIBR|nr:hypothetical protein VII00023_18939 [Vibrio ichthyoenteri ATCC 700023]
MANDIANTSMGNEWIYQVIDTKTPLESVVFLLAANAAKVFIVK